MYLCAQIVMLMKKFVLLLSVLFVSLFGFAKTEFFPYPDEIMGDTSIISYISVCNGTETLQMPPSLGFSTSCSYFCNGVRYYTTEPYIVITFNVASDTTIMCYIDSVNGLALNKVRALSFSVHLPPAITIPQDSIKHVTCPNGYLHPYADGAFHVDLVDSVQDYAWIEVAVDTPFFFYHTYHDAFTVSGLKKATYHITAHGTNGCVYRDSVTIEQPEAWYNNMDSVRVDTVCFGQTGCKSISVCGGTPPYSFTWFYYSDTGQVFMPDTTRLVCGLYSGHNYGVYMYDSRGC